MSEAIATRALLLASRVSSCTVFSNAARSETRPARPPRSAREPPRTSFDKLRFGSRADAVRRVGASFTYAGGEEPISPLFGGSATVRPTKFPCVEYILYLVEGEVVVPNRIRTSTSLYSAKREPRRSIVNKSFDASSRKRRSRSASFSCITALAFFRGATRLDERSFRARRAGSGSRAGLRCSGVAFIIGLAITGVLQLRWETRSPVVHVVAK